MSRYYPIMMQLIDKLVLVVGGGEAAFERCQDLLVHGARVRVVDPSPCELLGGAAGLDGVELRARRFHAGDLEEVALAFVAGADGETARRVSDLARRAGIPVNVGGDPELSDFQVPAHFKRGSLTLAVSTGGASEGLSRILCAEAADRVGPEYADLVGLLAVLRAAVVEKVADPERRRAILAQLGSGETRDLYFSAGAQAVERLAKGLMARQ